MSTRLCKIELNVKDYESKQSGTFSYHGEVVVVDRDLKQYDFRFYNTDSGTLVVSIDCSKKPFKVIEHSEAINLVMGIEVDKYHPCVYKLDATNKLELVTRTWEAKINENQIIFDYDLYDKNDVGYTKPLTRNRVKIDFEGENIAC